MKRSFKKAITHVLVHEGGWADHPQDPGGATMKGVTLAVFRRYYGSDKSKRDLRRITAEQLAHIYRTGYWDKGCCDDLPAGVDYAVFDSAVNSGPGRAAKWLQAAVGSVQDGAIGPKTLEKVASRDPRTVINDMLDLRLRFLKGLSTWPVFGRGWGRRVEDVRHVALELAGGPDQPLTPSMDYQVVRRGDQGDWVERLQAALGITVDGDFGPKTEAALKAWQTDNGLEPDGVAGRVTYRALGLIA